MVMNLVGGFESLLSLTGGGQVEIQRTKCPSDSKGRKLLNTGIRQKRNF
jgi:hypothetical protein